MLEPRGGGTGAADAVVEAGPDVDGTVRMDGVFRNCFDNSYKLVLPPPPLIVEVVLPVLMLLLKLVVLTELSTATPPPCLASVVGG